MDTSSTNQEIIYTDKFVEISFLSEHHTVLCTAKNPYIPETDFKKAFEIMGNTIREKRIKKMIFDKRKLTTFHQDSMTWYHVVWKVQMLEYGLNTYYKLLPQDKFFRMSVEIGKTKIQKENPHFDFGKFHIYYCESLEEALAQ